MKKVFEIKREDLIIRVEIPQVSEDFWIGLAVVVLIVGVFKLLISVM